MNAPPGGGEVEVGTYRIGPFSLAPEGQPGSESQASRANVPRPPVSFGMKSITFDLVDAAGNPVPHSAVHLHHVLLMNPARTSPYCSNWPERFAGAGSERTPMSLPDPYAYLVGSSERWVEDGKHITSAGVSAGIDMALHLVERLTSADISRLVQLAIEYDPQPPGGRNDWDHTDVPALTELFMARVSDNLADRPDLVERLIR